MKYYQKANVCVCCFFIDTKNIMTQQLKLFSVILIQIYQLFPICYQQSRAHLSC